jgi:deferrochelatase/peroxidase EfeB
MYWNPQGFNKQMASGKDNKVSRRQVLQMIGVGSAGLLLGAGGIGPLVSSGAKSTNSSGSIGKETDDALPFYGTYQQEITTPQQDFLYFAAFDIFAKRVTEVRELFQTWCHAAARMSQGDTVGTETANPHLPPTDTGEALGLSPSRLTFTFGVGPSLFVQNGIDRFGIAGKRPAPLIELPPFAGEELQAEWGGVQVCANDPQVAFHARQASQGSSCTPLEPGGFSEDRKSRHTPWNCAQLNGL